MHIISATEAKNKLASVMEIALREPVTIEKKGRPFVVMLSVEEYEKWAPESRKESFIRLCHDLAATAGKNGMTGEILASILASDAQ